MTTTHPAGLPGAAINGTTTATTGSLAPEPRRVQPGPAPAPPPLGAAEPLSAIYCAERAAACLHTIEAGSDLHASLWLQAADRWTHLAEVLAAHPIQRRPERDDDRERAR